MPVTPPMSSRFRPNWGFLSVVSVLHLTAVVGVLYAIFGTFSWWTVLLGWIWYVLCGMAITSGYHRFYSHRTFHATAPLRWFTLIFGAAAWQASVLSWCADHRDHHSFTDDERDPHSARRGFWWSHVLWLFKWRGQRDFRRVEDLRRQPGVRFQHRFYLPLAILFGLLTPAAIASLWGDFWGGLLIAGFLRVTLLLHATWCINSVAHFFGSRPYDAESTARDNAVASLITFGEGYHNFHHRFQSDYRNGIRWYHFDPGKWFIWTMERLGLARDLKRVPAERIERARRIARFATLRRKIRGLRGVRRMRSVRRPGPA